MKYDVFISYRRVGGEYTAKILCDRLSELGYNVFFDVEALRNGDFNIKLYSVIDECEDFILVLSPSALDRCNDENDWVRREIEYAIEKEKNIVPVMLSGFKFPDVLPASIECVRFKNGIEANTTFFDAFIEKLQKFLSTKPITAKFKKARPFIITAMVVLFICVIGALIFRLPKENSVNLQTSVAQEELSLYPLTAKEKNLVGEVVNYTQMNVANLDIMAKAAMDALDTADAYLSSTDRSVKFVSYELERYRKLIEDVNVSAYAPDEAFLERLADSPFNVADLKALSNIVSMFKEEYLDTLEQISFIISDEFYYSDDYKLKTLAQYRIMLESEIKAYSNSINHLLTPITDMESLKEWFEKIVLQFSVFDWSKDTWTNDKQKLELENEKWWKKYEQAITEMASLIGYASSENAEMQRDIDEMTAIINELEESEKEQTENQLVDMHEQEQTAFEMNELLSE